MESQNCKKYFGSLHKKEWANEEGKLKTQQKGVFLLLPTDPKKCRQVFCSVEVFIIVQANDPW